MRILQIINNLDTGGAERLITEMAPYIKKEGQHLTILLLKTTNSEFEKELKNKGFNIEYLSITGSCYNPFLILKMRKYLKGYDIIHANLFPTQYWVAIAHKLFRFNSVLVTTEHSTFNKRGKFVITSWIDKIIYGLFDGIICISDATKKFMQKRVPQSVLLETILNGIPICGVTPIFEHTYIHNKETKTFKLLQVARFSTQKDQETVIRSLTILPPNVHAYFAGDGATLSKCKILAKELGVSERTHFLGNVNDIDILWKGVDIGVMSSHWEGFGLAALEGMSHGIPVLCSNVSGLSEIVPSTKLLFCQGDYKELANKISALQKNAQDLNKLGVLCYESSKKYSIEAMVKKYLNFYRKLLNRNK